MREQTRLRGGSANPEATYQREPSRIVYGHDNGKAED